MIEGTGNAYGMAGAEKIRRYSTLQLCWEKLIALSSDTNPNIETLVRFLSCRA